MEVLLVDVHVLDRDSAGSRCWEKIPVGLIHPPRMGSRSKHSNKATGPLAFIQLFIWVFSSLKVKPVSTI